MKHTESKQQAKLLIALGVVIAAIQIVTCVFLTFRIQNSEERIYTDLHKVQVDVLKLQSGAQ